jgi:ligand-binding sensor domain-containing protein
MKVKSLVAKMLILTIVAMFALNGTTAGAFAKDGSESLLADLPSADQPVKLEDINAKGKPAADQTYSALQSQSKEIVFHHLTIDDGLSHNSVFDVLQDRLGFIWATTVQGINKYDGMTFTTFMPQASESSQSTPQFYMKILEDRDGILWFCNYGAGLVRYDPVLDTWKYYQHDEQNPNSLVHNTTWFVFQDRDGILWVSTDGGLSRFDPATGKAVNFTPEQHGLSSLTSDLIYQDRQGTIWVATYSGVNK